MTRPEHQSGHFIQLIEHHGGKALAFPSIAIEAVNNMPDSASILSSLNQYKLLIFTSVNAVNHAVLRFKEQHISIPEITNRVAAIGAATASALEAAGFQVSVKPSAGYNSEALLAEDALQQDKLQQQKVLILKGEGGRDKLYKALQQRGVDVYTIDLYRRAIPLIDSGLKRQQLSQNWHKLGVNCITVTSNEALQNLYDMLADTLQERMLQTPLIVPSLRCAELAEQLEFNTVCIAESALDQHMLEAIVACR